MSAGRILVVDDDPQIRRVMRVTLTGQGYEVDDARSGEDALETLREERFDLVLLDMNMPRMSGLELLEAMKKDAAMKKIPVVLVTTEESDEQTQRGLEAGAAAYVKKPFKNEELIAVVQRLTSAA